MFVGQIDKSVHLLIFYDILVGDSFWRCRIHIFEFVEIRNKGFFFLFKLLFFDSLFNIFFNLIGIKFLCQIKCLRIWYFLRINLIWFMIKVFWLSFFRLDTDLVWIILILNDFYKRFRIARPLKIVLFWLIGLIYLFFIE